MQKTSFFAAALFNRSFRASPSSLKRDVNNSIQSLNLVVCEWHSGSIKKKRTSVADDEPERQFDSKNPRRLLSIFFFLLTNLSLLTKTEILSRRHRSRPLRMLRRL